MNATNRIFSLPTPVAMATKFGTKWAITWLVQEISERFFCVYRDVFGGGLSNAANQFSNCNFAFPIAYIARICSTSEMQNDNIKLLPNYTQSAKFF